MHTPAMLRCPRCGVQPVSCFRRARRLRVHITALVIETPLDLETDGHEYVCEVCKGSVIDVDFRVST